MRSKKRILCAFSLGFLVIPFLTAAGPGPSTDTTSPGSPPCVLTSTAATTPADAVCGPLQQEFQELTNTVNFQNQQIATLELNIANQKQITLSTLQSVFQQVQQPESVGTSINAQLTTENQLTAQNNALLQFLQNQTAQMSAALQNAQIATTSDAQAQDLQPVWDQGIIYPVVAGGNITEDSDLTQPSSLSVDQINLFLQNTPLAGLGSAYLQAEATFGVSAYWLVAASVIASDWGYSALAQTKYNLFGYVSNDANPYQDAQTFPSFAACIGFVAQDISANYLVPNGEFYHGASMRGMNVSYSTDPLWASNIALTAQNLQNIISGSATQASQKPFSPLVVIGTIAENSDLTQPSLLTVDQINQFLQNTPLAGLGSAYLQAEATFGVSAYWLVGASVLESDWGYSDIAQEKNNLFGYGANDANPYQDALTFTSFSACIDFVAQVVSTNYLAPTGEFFSSPTMQGMNVYYATDPLWASKIAAQARNLQNTSPTP